MIVGEATAVVRRSARDILEFVLDLDRYRRADTKVRHVQSSERRGTEGTVRYTARLRGLPTPVTTMIWRLVPYARLEFQTADQGWLEALLLDRFQGLFVCEQTAAGTVVTHRETFVFHAPFGWLIDPFLRGWLARDVRDEMARLEQLLEGTAPTTLLDDVMPVYDFASRHAIVVAAPAAQVAEAAESHRLDSSRIVRLLFRLRGLGSAPRTLRAALTGGGFAVLAERPGQETVLGTAGRFWALDEAAALGRPADAAAFAAFREPGSAKAAVSLRIAGRLDGTTELSTETRIACVDAAAYARFAAYWAVIKPFSGLIRRLMLRGIARHAVAMAAPEAAPLPVS